MSKPLITGVGISDFGRFPDLTEEALAQVAILNALDDAGIAISEVQGFYCAHCESSTRQGRPSSMLTTRARAVPPHCTWHWMRSGLENTTPSSCSVWTS